MPIVHIEVQVTVSWQELELLEEAQVLAARQSVEAVDAVLLCILQGPLDKLFQLVVFSALVKIQVSNLNKQK